MPACRPGPPHSGTAAGRHHPGRRSAGRRSAGRRSAWHGAMPRQRPSAAPG